MGKLKKKQFLFYASPNYAKYIDNICENNFGVCYYQVGVYVKCLQAGVVTSSDVQLVKHDQGRTQVLKLSVCGARFNHLVPEKHNRGLVDW